MPLKTSPSGVRFIIFMEGSRSTPYMDVNGHWTCGVGHLMADGEDIREVWSRAKIAQVLTSDLQTAERAVNDVGVPLEQPQFDALVSLAFNIGCGAFSESTVVRDLRKLRYFEAADAILMWNDKGLLAERRAAERGVFIYGCAQ